MAEIKVLGQSSQEEKARRKDFVDSLKKTPIPDNELMDNLGLYLKRQTLSRILFMQELYQKIINVHGVVMEFGVRWGQNLSLFQSFRGIYEPFNYNRKIIGFDTFEGFPNVDEKDGSLISQGNYSVSDEYERDLDAILHYHEQESPIPHIKKYEIVKGDATETIYTYLERQPETIIALAYFDFDIYSPTKACLEAIKSRMTKGSVIAFDELNCPQFPGETIAVQEVFGLENIRLQRSPLAPLCSYFIVE